MIVEGDTNVYGTCFHLFQTTGLNVNTTTTPATLINGTTGPLPPGTYEISVNYSWNRDSVGSDFISTLEVNGFVIHTVYESMHRQEPKDSGAGATFPGTGTDQAFGFHKVFYFELVTPGSINTLLEYRSQVDGLAASAWDGSIKIIRVD